MKRLLIRIFTLKGLIDGFESKSPALWRLHCLSVCCCFTIYQYEGSVYDLHICPAGGVLYSHLSEVPTIVPSIDEARPPELWMLDVVGQRHVFGPNYSFSVAACCLT